jgi:hypothetical protein
MTFHTNLSRKGFILFLLAPLCILSACSKDSSTGSSGGGHYMKFKLNGTLVEYSGQAEGTYNKTGGSQYSSGISGLKEAFVATKNNMSLALATSTQTQTAITYTNYTTSGAGFAKALISSLSYFDEQGKFYTTWPEEFIPAIPPATEVNSKIKITEANDHHIKGIFSGVMYSEDYSIKLVVTDGEFYVERKS